jgi:hypothetical protein
LRATGCSATRGQPGIFSCAILRIASAMGMCAMRFALSTQPAPLSCRIPRRGNAACPPLHSVEAADLDSAARASARCGRWSLPVEPQNDQSRNKHRHQHQRRAGPDKAAADIGWLVSRGVKEFLRHGVAPPLEWPATAAHVAPALPQFRSGRASPTHRPDRSCARTPAPLATSCGRPRSLSAGR